MDLASIIGLALAALGALVGLRWKWKRDGAAEVIAKGKQKDEDNAKAIADRVHDDRAQRVRELDDAGYRD